MLFQSNTPCSVPGCPALVWAKGFCNTHYARLRRGLELETPYFARGEGTAEERFWAIVKKDGPIPDYAPHLGPCWIWTRAKDSKGYGAFNDGEKVWRAHRFAYVHSVGDVPEGLSLDHLCRVRHCVNPTHLEPVTTRENLLRGMGSTAIYARRTHCPKGHPLSGSNLQFRRDGSRICRLCRQESRRLSALRRRSGVAT